MKKMLVKGFFVDKARTVRAALIVGLISSCVIQGGAQITFPVTLTSSPDNGADQTAATINLNAGQGYVPGWTVNGVGMLTSQAFYYSVGNNAASQIDSMPLSGAGQTFAGAVYGTYAAGGVSITPSFRLGSAVGPTGSLNYTLTENITVLNTLGTAQTISLFHVSQFSLGNPSGPQVINMSTLHPGTQFEASQLSNWPVHPSLQDVYSVSPANGAVTTSMRADYNGPFTGNTPLSGPTAGASNFAFESSATLGAGQSFTINEIMNLDPIPEPSSLAVVSAGMLALAFLRRTRKA